MGKKRETYFDIRAKNYLKKSDHGIWRIFRIKERDTIRRLLSARPNSSLLDLGSGAGYYSLYFKTQHQLEVFAVDSSAQMIKELKENGIPCLKTSIEEMVSSHMFDNALAAGVLEFMEKPEIFFKKIGPMIKPGGRLVLLIPEQGLSGWVYKVIHAIGGCHTNIRSSQEYEKIAEMFGFKRSANERATMISRALCFEKAIAGTET